MIGNEEEGVSDVVDTNESTNTKVVYCCHCGNFEVSEENSYCSGCESLETTIDDGIRAFSEVMPYKHLLSLGIHVQYLYGDGSFKDEDKQNKRKSKLQQIVDRVSALLNTESGHILIHIVGRNKEDTYLGAFDEFVDQRLASLINDGRLFADVYKKENPSKYQGCSNYSNFLVLTVEKSDYLLTSDFKTKYATDVNIVDIREDTLRRFLKDKKPFKTFHHQIDFHKLDETPSIPESREVQLKAIYRSQPGDNHLVTHILTKLNLPKYVSAFSKNCNGGSFVAGVKEENQVIKGEETGVQTPYVSKKLQYKPATIDNPETFPGGVQEGLKYSCLVCDYEGNREDADTLVNVTLKKHMKGGEHHRNKYIIVVSVRPVRGIVFYDREGPVAYKVSEDNPNSIERLSFETWFKAMKQNMERCA